MSKKEQEMFKALGLERLLEAAYFRENPTALYVTAIKHVFKENLTGLAVESLRRCYIAYTDCKIYRETPEFDALIQL